MLAKYAPIHLLNLVKEIKKVVSSDRDFGLIISGIAGEGKSTLASQIAMLMDRKFTFERNLAFTRKQFLDAIQKGTETSLPECSPIQADEAINLLFARQAMHGEQIQLLQALDMCRDRHLALILCVPNFFAMDKHYLNTRVRAWLYVEKRGIAHLFKPDLSPYNDDPWHRKDNMKFFKKWSEGMSLRGSPNYIDTVKFPDLSKNERVEYERVKHESRVKITEGIEAAKKKLEKDKILQRLSRMRQRGINVKDIAKIEGVQTKTISNLLKKLPKVQLVAPFSRESPLTNNNSPRNILTPNQGVER